GVALWSASGEVAEEIEMLGRSVRLVRRGVGGDLRTARDLVAELNGQVDAIGIGGTDLYLSVGGRSYAIRDAVRIASAAARTPVVCGAGLKDTRERRAVAEVEPGGRWGGPRL